MQHHLPWVQTLKCWAVWGRICAEAPLCAQEHARPIVCTRQEQPLVHSACKRLYQEAGGPPTQERP